MLDYYGLTTEDMQGSETDELVRRLAHPDDVEPFLAAWERGFAGTAPWETEAHFRRRDGEYRWFLVRVTPLRDDGGRIVRWYVTGTDIDDRKKAEESGRTTGAAPAVRGHPAAHLRAGRRRRLLDANRTALEFWASARRRRLQSAVDTDIAALFHPTTRELRDMAHAALARDSLRTRGSGPSSRWPVPVALVPTRRSTTSKDASSDGTLRETTSTIGSGRGRATRRRSRPRN
jgi:PAS domain S-box-containing protein